MIVHDDGVGDENAPGVAAIDGDMNLSSGSRVNSSLVTLSAPGAGMATPA